MYILGDTQKLWNNLLAARQPFEFGEVFDD
jgi:hypothetical protein